MIGTSKKIAIVAAMTSLGIALVACDDPDPVAVDAGRDSGMETDDDAGQDAGEAPPDSDMEDGGPPDAGPPPANLRLAHMIANVEAPMGAVHLCLEPPGVAQFLLTRSGATPAPIPYGGVSAYTNAITLNAAFVYTVHVYSAADVIGSECPAEGDAIFSADIEGADLMAGNSYTIAAVGRIGSTTQAPGLVVIQDDNTDPMADMTRVRIVHTITSVPGLVDVCFDPDGPTGEMPGELIAAGVAYVGGATAVVELPYTERDPIAAGALLIYARGAGAAVDCAAPTGAPTLAFPIPFPVPTGAGIPENITATIDAADVVSIFLRGDAVQGGMAAAISCTPDATACEAAGNMCHPTLMRCLSPQGPSLTPWIDNLAPAAP